MTTVNYNRRQFSVLAGSALAAAGVARAEAAPQAMDAANKEISRSSAAIHEEIDFAASAAHVYDVLTTSARFDRVVQHSSAMNSDMKKMLGTKPTVIDARPGGGFTLFGGYISGFNLELMANTRIVQAWREGS